MRRLLRDGHVDSNAKDSVKLLLDCPSISAESNASIPEMSLGLCGLTFEYDKQACE